MIDIHCHVLPGLDDGPGDVGTSIRMSKMAARDGIRHVVATPHFRCGEGIGKGDIKRGYEEFMARLREESVSIGLSFGADIALTYELLGALDGLDLPTIGGSRYFLLELPPLIPPNFSNFFFTAVMKGFVPVVTHPERNYSFLASPGKLGELRDAGALFQLTAMSITGGFGPDARRLSHMMIRKGLADFVASDGHDDLRRKPVLSDAYNEVMRSFDNETARRLFCENPGAVIENREITI